MISLSDKIAVAFRTSKGSWMRRRFLIPENKDLILEACSKFPSSSSEESIWLAWKNIDIPTCLHCFKLKKFKSLKDGYGGLYCSVRCASINTSKSRLETSKKNGTLCIFGSNKYKERIQELYGVQNVGESEEIQNKIKRTMLERHGVSTGFKLVKDRVSSQQSSTSKNKRAITNTKRYGSDSPFSNSAVQAKSKQTLQNIYGVRNPIHIPEVQERLLTSKLNTFRKRRIHALSSTLRLLSPIENLKNKNSVLNWECCTCKQIIVSNLDDGKTPKCKVCFPNSKVGSKLIERFLNLMGTELGPVRVNDRTELYPFELDFYWPKYRLAVKLNGLYWHSEHVKGERDSDIKKLILASKQNITLLTFYEDEVLEKSEQIKSIILARAGIFKQRIPARKTKVIEITSAEASAFMEINHLQGKAGGFLRLGLKYNDELVSVMIIGKSRFNKKYNYELVRFSQVLNTQVLGGFSKLLSAAKTRITGTIVSYADRRVFTGASYQKAGFELLHITKPGFYWTDYTSRYNRQQFQKHKLFGIGTVSEQMMNMKMDKIWDCGQIVFTMQVDQ